MRITKRNHDGGFTLIEMVVASGVILSVVSVFAVFMTSVSTVQSKLLADQVLTSILTAEVEKVNALSWDDIVMADSSPSALNAICAYSDPGRTSTRAIFPGPELVVYPDDFIKSSNTNSVTPLLGRDISSKRLVVQVYRKVVWYSDPTVQVGASAPTPPSTLPTCDYRPDLKKIVITVKLFTIKKATVTEATGADGKITFKAANSFTIGDEVSVTGLNNSAFNITNKVITNATSDAFTVSGAAVGTTTGANAVANAVNNTPDITKDSPFTTKSQTLVKSSFTEAVLGNNDETVYVPLQELGNANVKNASLWGVPYNDGQSVASGCSAAAYTDPVAQQVYIQGVYNPSGSSICGYTFTGFTPGTRYTAVAEIYVPNGSTTTEIAVAGSGRGEIALPSSSWTTISYSWTATGTTYVIGPAASNSAQRPSGSNVRIRSLIVYVN